MTRYEKLIEQRNELQQELKILAKRGLNKEIVNAKYHLVLKKIEDEKQH
jgi:hypothetical protein